MILTGTELIQALALMKSCAASANADLGVLPRDLATAIEEAADAIAGGAHYDQFVVDVIQAAIDPRIKRV